MRTATIVFFTCFAFAMLGGCMFPPGAASHYRQLHHNRVQTQTNQQQMLYQPVHPMSNCVATFNC